jgi:colanic acid biosynthesis glycosyl transferase WcaI
MRILLVIIQFPPDVNSTGLLMEQVCAGLTAGGHEVSVLTTFPHYEGFRVWPEYRGKLAERSRDGGLDVLRLYVYASGSKRRMGHRLLSYLSFNALATLAGLLSRRPHDVILCTNGSFFSGLTAAAIGAAKGIPFVWNVQDLYPDVPVKTGQLRNRHAVAVLRRIERFIYRRAAHLAVITPSFRDNLVAKGVPAEKITVIPNFADTEVIRPLPKANPFGEEHGLAGRFVVAHAGNVGYVYDLDTMLETAALLRDEREILFLVVGTGVTRPALEAKARRLGLENVRFLPFQPRDRLPWLRAACDVQVALYRRGSASDSMPSKVYEIMASGRPLLASAEPGSDVRDLVEATECGLCVDPEDPRQLAGAVLRLYRDPELRRATGARGRWHAERSYSRRAVVARYQELLAEVVSRGGAAGAKAGRARAGRPGATSSATP